MRRLLYLARRFFVVARTTSLRTAIHQAKDFISQRIFRPKSSRTYPPSLRAGDIRISILVPVYNTPSGILEEAINSVLNQTYPNWELCLCDDCSDSLETVRVLEKYRGIDPRIKVVRSPKNLHIAGATNLAAEFATGHFVAFLDHDDTLDCNALRFVVKAIEENEDVDVLYTDEDKIEADGRYSEPYLKPDWSPEHLLSVMYVLHFTVIRKSLFLELGGLRDAYTGAQDYDLALRATARARRVVHIPEVLYHWRKIPGSAAAVVDAKPAALINAKRAVADFVQNQEPDAEVVDGLFPGSYRVKWPVDASRPVTLLMLTDSRMRDVEGRGNILLVEHSVTSILSRSTFRNFQIIVLDNGRLPADVHERFIEAGVTVAQYHFQGAFNFPDKMNHALSLVTTEDVIILNDDIEVISPDWIEALLSFSRRQDVGAVGAQLVYPNNRLQHAGVVMGVNGLTTHIFHNQPAVEVGYCGFTHLIRNYSAVTGAVLATRMSLVREVGMFNRRLRVDYNDIDFCLRLGAAGYRIVYTPHASLYHFEGSSLARREVDEADRGHFFSQWQTYINADPYYNPRLPKDRTDCAVLRW
ncbi:glycosyltransferase (plasmid) [Rhizobium sp. CB3171]|uniref:glycosyltransferase family 2 protein n=1 Tax=Rhizobium sp. CB3171 TaxID=3039157 RepID=UPI0024B1DC88|nr:glycosyltransferase [Rhizobium sp. CB3171]WFU05944.1 glycosyltransferase [Rhizobium sp. CB3171]